jgi:hypothetical protein
MKNFELLGKNYKRIALSKGSNQCDFCDFSLMDEICKMAPCTDGKDLYFFREIKRRGHLRGEIKGIGDYIDICDDILSEYLETFTIKKGLCREPVDEDRENFEGIDLSRMYTQEGMKLYYSACEKLHKLGEKHFPDETFEISSSAMLMP